MICYSLTLTKEERISKMVWFAHPGGSRNLACQLLNQVTIFSSVQCTVSGVPLKRRESHLLHIQDSGSNHNDFNSIISFHKVKALVSSGALVKPDAMPKCEGCVSVEVLSPQQRVRHSLLMSSQIFCCAAAVNSSWWASGVTNFTCTFSDTVEVLWRVWKRIFPYGVGSLWQYGSEPSALKSPFTSFCSKGTCSSLTKGSGNAAYLNVIYSSVQWGLLVSARKKMKSLQRKLSHKILARWMCKTED